MVSDRCELCKYWLATSSSQSKAECDKTGKVTRYDEECKCGKFTRS